MSRRGAAIATPHHLATQVGSQILGAGGNATDATIAANAVLGVVAPETCGIGGDMFALIWHDGLDQPDALNASGPAGSGSDAQMLRRANQGRMPHMGVPTITVPGCVGGWEALAARHGSMPLTEVLTPAIALADGGFSASPELARSLAARHDALAGQPAAEGLYPGGAPPRTGDRLHRPGLAVSLRAIAMGGAAAHYGGAAGVDIVDATAGNITQADLIGFEPAWVEPIGVPLFGITGWTVPPNSQGYLTLATLAIFESTGVEPGDPAWTHLLIESYRTAAANRDAVLSDPRFLPSQFSDMTDRAHLASLGGAIDWAQAGRFPTPARAPGGTAYLCAVDGNGMAVSFIQSNFSGIGSGVGAGKSGFFLHNRGAGFNLIEGHPNEIAPGKRPLHTLSPTLWTGGGRAVALLGTRGGHQQPQILAQVAASTLGAGESIEHAQQAVRWTIDEFGPGTNSSLAVESRISPVLKDDLENRGHRVQLGRPLEPGWGPVSMIAVGDGPPATHPDPRVSTTSVAIA